MRRVEERISDGRLRTLIEAWMKQDIVKDMERRTPTSGTPQGAVISPLLANLYLHPLDVQMANQGCQMVRYADDAVILCRTEEEARAALAELQRWVETNGLTLHPDKTHVGDCRIAGQGFEFLGYRFEAGRRWVRRKSFQALQDKIRAQTKRPRGVSLERMIADLNPMLRGWYGYFQHAHRYTFGPIDGFVRRRLRAVLRKQKGRPGTGTTHDDHRRWPNAFFANTRLFTMTTAWHLASQSRY